MNNRLMRRLRWLRAGRILECRAGISGCLLMPRWIFIWTHWLSLKDHARWRGYREWLGVTQVGVGESEPEPGVLAMKPMLSSTTALWAPSKCPSTCLKQDLLTWPSHIDRGYYSCCCDISNFIWKLSQFYLLPVYEQIYRSATQISCL